MEQLGYNFLHFWFLFKLNINVSISFFQPVVESQDKGVYMATIFPSLTWNNDNVGPLLSNNS